MPKIRGVKPETWTDDKFVRLSPLARLLFIGMWNLACDNGHVEDNAIQLKIRLLPMDSCDVMQLVTEMIETGQVERLDGYLKVIKLAEHQHIDMRWLSTCEWCELDEHKAFTPDQKKPRKKSAPLVLVEQPASTPLVLDADGDGDGDVELNVSGVDEAAPAPAAKKKPTSRKRPATPLTHDWTPTDEHHAKCIALGIDPATELGKFKAHAEANDRRQVNWNAAFTQWLLSARPTSGNVRRLPGTPDPDAWMSRRPK